MKSTCSHCACMVATRLHALDVPWTLADTETTLGFDGCIDVEDFAPLASEGLAPLRGPAPSLKGGLHTLPFC